MSETNETASGTGAKVLAGLLTRAQLAAEMGCSERTVLRYEKDGLPVITIGGARFYAAVKVRDWIMAHLRRDPSTAPRSRGRPKGSTKHADRHAGA